MEEEEQELAAEIPTNSMGMEEQKPATETLDDDVVALDELNDVATPGLPDEERSNKAPNDRKVKDYWVPMAAMCATSESFGSYGPLHTTSWDFQ